MAELLTMTELAKVLGCSRQNVSKHNKNGVFDGCRRKINGRWMFHRGQSKEAYQQNVYRNRDPDPEVQEPPEGLDEFEKLIVFDAFNVSTLISRIDFALNQIESFTDNLSDETEAITIKDQAGKIRSLFTSQRDFNMEQELNDFQLSMSTLGFVSAHLKHDQQQAIDAALDRIATTMDCEMVSVEGSPGRRLIFNE